LLFQVPTLKPSEALFADKATPPCPETEAPSKTERSKAHSTSSSKKSPAPPSTETSWMPELLRSHMPALGRVAWLLARIAATSSSVKP
jgi:hypothetical protein